MMIVFLSCLGWNRTMRLGAAFLTLSVLLLAGARASADAEQENALREIKKVGGSYELDMQDPDRPVMRIVLRGPKITDELLTHVKAFPRLQELWLATRPSRTPDCNPWKA
jgi:hypothetical protein